MRIFNIEFGIGSRHIRFICDGRVACDLRGRDVEVDVCAGCQWLTHIDRTADRPYICCNPRAIAEIPAREL